MKDLVYVDHTGCEFNPPFEIEIPEEPKECKVCQNNGNDYCFACDNGSFFKPVSNYALFISRTPEELAELFKNLCCPSSLGGKVDCNIENRGCSECWLSWLTAPVEDGE